MNFLVTGANGQLGFDVLKQINNRFPDASVSATDADTLDICDMSAVRSALKGIDVVINCAAFTNVDLCETEQETAYKVNCDGVKNLAQACNEENALLIHISTDYVFDGTAFVPYIEEDITNPQTVYGKSKLAGEKEAEKCKKHFILRTSWLYGENGKNFVKTMINLGKTKDFVKVVNDQTGTPTLSSDLAEVIISLTERDDYGIYHCTGNGESVTWFEFTKEIYRLKGINTPVLPCTTEEFNAKAKRPKYSVLENRKLKALGLDTMKDWKIALKEFLNERKEL